MNTQTAERPLAHAVVTVQYVNPAKQQGKSGSIKDVDGQFFSVWPNMLAMFQPGGTYEIEFTETVKNGVMYRDIKRATPAGPIAPPPASFVSTAEVVTQRQAKAQPSAAPAGDQFWKPKPRSPEDSMQIWVCTMLRADIEANRVGSGEQELADRAAMWARIWLQTFSQDGHE